MARPLEAGLELVLLKEKSCELLNVVHAWFVSDGCPCVVADSPDDKIDYPDFAAAWNLEDHECPGPQDFSRLIQLI